MIKEYKEDPWRLVAVYLAAGLFLGVGALLRGGFWVVGGVGGGICLLMALYSTFIGRVKIRLTESGIDYTLFGVVIPYRAIHDVRLSPPLGRPDPSGTDCVWIQIDPEITKGFGFLASRAMMKCPDGTVWLPVGLVGQSEYKSGLFFELGNRVSIQRGPNRMAEQARPVSVPPLRQRPAAEAATSASDDPIAMRLDWAPILKSGTSGRTRKLRITNAGCAVFVATKESQGWALFILGFGIILIMTNLCGMLVMPAIADVCRFSWPAFFAGVGAASFGVIRLYLEATPILFDMKAGVYRKGRKAPEAIVKLIQIHALQLVSHQFIGQQRSFTSCELNLVLKNGGRLHVLSSGDGVALRKDAETLSAFLGSPLWSGNGVP